MTDVAMVTLHARTWVRLSGTGYEVYLHGKTGELLVRCSGGPFADRSLPSTVYVRRAGPPEAKAEP